MKNYHGQLSGTIALVGSGEYTDAMNATDRVLLDTLGGPKSAQVAVLPTASGLELGKPQEWNERGTAHFRALGAPVTALSLVGRDDAHDQQIVAALRDANFHYFSGGNPEYVTTTLRDTPAWEAIITGHRRGGVLAGCSAGAMMLGGHTLSVRSVANGNPPAWLPGLDVVPGLVILPHFDRVARFVGDETFRKIIASAPASATLIGVDEDTALVYVPRPDAQDRWQVMGHQTVSVFTGDGSKAVYQPGEVVVLQAFVQDQ